MGRAASTDSSTRRRSSTSAACSAREPSPRDEHRLGVEQVRDLSQAVLAQRLATRDEVDHGVGDAEAGRELDRAGQLDELALHAELGELEFDGAPVRGRDTPTRQVLHVVDVRVGRHRNGEAAAAEPERQQLVELDARFEDHVASGDAELDRAVSRPARDVVCAREEQLEIEVEAVHVQRPPVRREPDAGVMQQLLGLLGEAPLRREREADQATACHVATPAATHTTPRPVTRTPRPFPLMRALLV